MGYVAVEAGEDVIQRAEELFEKQRVVGESDQISVEQVGEQFSRLTAQAMSEGGLYAPRLAAIAVKQAQGDTAEAAFLLRAYRSTLERWGTSVPVETAEVFTTRRVSPAYKDVPGGQVLGATKDYTQRLLDFELIDDDGTDPTGDWDVEAEDPPRLRNVMEVLREDGLVYDPERDPDRDDDASSGAGTEPFDATREPITFPAPRSAVLQELARGETGAVTALGYSELRGYGQVHPTLGEVRTGDLPVTIEHPYTGDEVEVTTAAVTETECVVPIYEKSDDPQFSFGYGLVFGRNERKTIGMSILDAAIQLDGEGAAQDAEFVLDVVDGIDSFGFIEHLKLPHYVTFQSILDRIRSIRERSAAAADETDPAPQEVGADD
ncbi:carbon-phosphorus lyase complex subunit PhnI [Natronomonas sp. LN261]|jgi:alpha-D-ribose 1-methylphosphonate 5-triphosphate synthase subunit PhnI|uniref:carbon-phosphorus lyase complex subunit PhnI n=1 Tax=Natronomonas sp. LN261 TaxID=2750669 RepID=UPI0015EF8675|nr:carbon-phosphorus lyase complex subunit PhnI [Natronomonas sp. LN261]